MKFVGRGVRPRGRKEEEEERREEWGPHDSRCRRREREGKDDEWWRLLDGRGLGAAEAAGAAGGDEADLLAGRGDALRGGGVADVLVVAAAEGVLHRVHGDAADLGPFVALDAVLVVGAAGLEHGFVGAAAAGDDADHGAAPGVQRFLAARRQPKFGRALVLVVRHHYGVVAGAARESAAVAGAGLDVGDDAPLGNRGERQDVPDDQLSLGAAVDERRIRQAFHRDHELVVALVAVRVLELHLHQRRAAPGLVQDFLHSTLHVTVLLRVIDLPQLHRTLPQPRVRREHRPLAFPLPPNHLTHLLFR
mmetsp:Transcript_871/g.2448  ORF Transcript_871/g.2448 Transcript_871/m.2448 type:complete len:306 (+) Transcript_871:157-1074(+)